MSHIGKEEQFYSRSEDKNGNYVQIYTFLNKSLTQIIFPCTLDNLIFTKYKEFLNHQNISINIITFILIRIKEGCNFYGCLSIYCR